MKGRVEEEGRNLEPFCQEPRASESSTSFGKPALTMPSSSTSKTPVAPLRSSNTLTTTEALDTDLVLHVHVSVFYTSGNSLGDLNSVLGSFIFLSFIFLGQEVTLVELS